MRSGELYRVLAGLLYQMAEWLMEACDDAVG